MAGIEINREAFFQANTPERRPLIDLLGPVLTLLALSLVAFVGYKVYLVNVQNTETAQANEHIQQLNQQLAEMQKRMDALEKHRAAMVTPTAQSAASEAQTHAPDSKQPARTIYRIASASALPAQPKAAGNPSPVATASPAPQSVNSAEIAGEVAANREAWEATTDRLTDVVGVIGKQQGEISATREELNRLMVQTHRQAISFEIARHNAPLSVGPVTLQFKSVDAKSQHFTLCVFFNDRKCIEVRDRALNEVVVFIVSKNNPPLELVATKIDRDQIVGYLEVPVGMQ